MFSVSRVNLNDRYLPSQKLKSSQFALYRLIDLSSERTTFCIFFAITLLACYGLYITKHRDHALKNLHFAVMVQNACWVYVGLNSFRDFSSFCKLVILWREFSSLGASVKVTLLIGRIIVIIEPLAWNFLSCSTKLCNSKQILIPSVSNFCMQLKRLIWGWFAAWGAWRNDRRMIFELLN